MGNIRINKPKHKILLETTNGIVTYSGIVLETSPCTQSMWFDPVVMLNAVAVNKNNLVERKRMSHLATYYDHNEN